MSYKLEFTYDCEIGCVKAVCKFSDFVSLQDYAVDIGYFLVGSDEFFIDTDAEFLTASDMKAIIAKMEEYNGN